ncbi:MAG: ABC transporter ATP-binding protein [Clostridiales bacterium]|nr:ABC transporter ATP-binding protein [Clostridiales bacterium]MCF8021424.1 ABC transporter ATP-binding protein [Clostridiales bacterium]
MENQPIIEAVQLLKKYKDFNAVNNINFKINPGECCGFVGPNGAGKTTTVKMISCFSPVSSGKLYVMGMDVRYQERDIKKKLGIVHQENNLDLDLSLKQNLLIYASYFDIPKQSAIPRIKELLHFLNLEDKENERVENLSGGMKRKLTIARSLINNPELLILDEPTTGLDPGARHLVWERLIKLKKSGKTLLLTTHYLEEANRLCDRLFIMNQGKILEEGAPKELVNKYAGHEVLELEVPINQKDSVLMYIQRNIHGYIDMGNRLHIFPVEGRKLLASLQQLQQHDMYFTHQYLRPANLEDVFFKLTGKGLE